MNPIIAFNVISNQFSKHESELLKLQFDVNASADSTVYVQVHDFPKPADLAAGRNAPAPGSVPIESWPTPAGAIDVYKEFKRGDLAVTYGLFVCVSTTQPTLTIGTGNNKFDSVAAELISQDVVGTETNQQGGGFIQVWSDASGKVTQKMLIRAVGVNLESQVRYLQLYAIEGTALSSGVGGSIPIMSWPLAATGDSGGADIKLVSFGSVGSNSLRGIDFRDISIILGSIVTKQACTLALSKTQGFYTAITSSGANFYAEYK